MTSIAVDYRVGDVLPTGDIVVMVGDAALATIPPVSKWKYCTWEEAIRYCHRLGYVVPTKEHLEAARHHISVHMCGEHAGGVYLWSLCDYTAANAWSLNPTTGKWHGYNKRLKNYICPFKIIKL